MPDFQIRVNRWDDVCRSLYIQIPISDRGVAIAVHQSISLHDYKPEPATINWPSIGTVSPAHAELFGQGLVEAARVAREIEQIGEWSNAILADWREYSRAEQEAGRERPWPRAIIHAGCIRVLVPDAVAEPA